MIVRVDRSHDAVHDTIRDKVHATDPDEPRDVAFFHGCLVAVALTLITGAGVVALVRWLCAEVP